MSQKVVNRTTGLVDYKELETNILSSIRDRQAVDRKRWCINTIYKKTAGGKFGR